jgi:hypothetical protein
VQCSYSPEVYDHEREGQNRSRASTSNRDSLRTNMNLRTYVQVELEVEDLCPNQRRRPGAGRVGTVQGTRFCAMVVNLGLSGPVVLPESESG